MHSEADDSGGDESDDDDVDQLIHIPDEANRIGKFSLLCWLF